MESKAQFLHVGFKQVEQFRVFLFERVNQDRTRAVFTIKADVALSRRYGITLQELPLLCREQLECAALDGEKRSFVYSEAEMCRHADSVAARKKIVKGNAPQSVSR